MRWRPGDFIPEIGDSAVGADTETELIKNHEYPPVVCLQAYSEGLSNFVWYTDIPAWLQEFDAVNPGATYVFHNIGFDFGVLGKPDTLLKALKEDRVIDTFALDSLRCAKDDGMVRKDRKLNQIARRRLGIELDKSDEVRLTFTRDMVMDEAHETYAMSDAKVTYDLAEIMDWRSFPTLALKTRMLVALDDIERRGFLTDESIRKNLLEKFTKQEKEYDVVLADWGWIKGVKGNTLVLQQILRGLEIDFGITFPRTPKSGAIQITDEALEQLEDSPFIDAYKARSYASHMVSTYLKDGIIKEDGRVRTRFELVSTMRTSSKTPNIQLGVVKLFELLESLMMRTLQRGRKLRARTLEKICIKCSFMVYSIS